MNKSKWITGLGLLLLAAALCWSIWNFADEMRAGRAVQQITQQIEQVEAQQGTQTQVQQRPAYLDDPTMPMPSIEVDGQEYIGFIRIPEIGMDLPVFGSWNYTLLKEAPCWYSGSVYMDDMILMGHDYKRHFGPIKKLPMGTRVEFEDGDGNIFVYEAKEAQVLDATALEEMEQGDWDLTLFTCTKDGNARYALRCDRISAPQA